MNLNKGSSVVVLAAALMASGGAFAQEATADPEVIMNDPKFEAAVEHLRTNYDRQVEELVELIEIPSGPFMEEEISAHFAEVLGETGLENVHVDEEGNVIGEWRGTNGDGKFLVVSAHLDTVFPEGTDVTVNWQGTEIHAPGSGDDKASVAALPAFVRAMEDAGIQTEDDILFVGTVGEEGQGDLRGVRYLFNEGEYQDKIKGFFSLEGGDPNRLTTGGTGSMRYRVTYEGPGGHSYGAFGTVNPAYAMANFMSAFSEIEVPADPKTTHSVGTLEGGTSVNSIPFSISAEVDMRSVDPDELARVNEEFLAIVEEAAAAENERNDTENGEITANLELIGDRPAGDTDRESDLVKTTVSVLNAFGHEEIEYRTSSTDSNIPISMGIPAITMNGARPRSGRSHSLDEWVDTDIELVVPAMRQTLTVILANAGYVAE